MTIALVMMKMSLISMSNFVEYIDLASTHQIGKKENTNEREETSQYPPIISYDESGNK